MMKAKITKTKKKDSDPLPTYGVYGGWTEKFHQDKENPDSIVLDGKVGEFNEWCAITLLRLFDSWGKLDPPLDIEEFRPRAGFEIKIIEFSTDAVRLAIKHKDEYRDYVFRIDGDGNEFP